MARSLRRSGTVRVQSEIVAVHAGEQPPEEWTASIFLAGPTPYPGAAASWWPTTLIEIRKQWDQPGRLVVFVPEPRDSARRPDHDTTHIFKRHWGDRADIVLIWIPRGPGMLEHTINDEFDRWKDSGRAVFGTPAGIRTVRYQHDHTQGAHLALADTLPATVCRALDLIDTGAPRSGGHRDVPLILYRTPSFARWLQAQEAAGNELRGGRLEWIFLISPTTVLFWAFHALVYVTAEDRVKANEVVLSRPDIAAVVAYRRGDTLHETKVALVREFRSSAATNDGFVRELPGGSGPSAPAEQAAAEMSEETGLTIRPHQLRAHVARQPAATVSAHQLHLFSVELDDDQLAALESATETRGNTGETERTTPEIRTVRELLNDGQVDWTTLGAIFQALSTYPATRA